MITSNELADQKVTSSITDVVDTPPVKGASTTAPFDPEALVRLVEVRTNILRGGVFGMGYGIAIGTIVHISIDRFLIRTGVIKRFNLRNPSLLLPQKFPRHSFLPTILICGALGSFTSSCVTGRNSFNSIGDIWTTNLNHKSGYQNNQNQMKSNLHTEQDEAFERRTAQIKESKAIKEELEKWGPPKS
jgi:hypothetical protein